ncbi:MULTISPECIES: ArsR/SmtB family transcription factor [Streptomyces]|jgi:DNA-binding transcriptional ArsR family regulator|uniref:ArsR/SmtB family transcription factor n=1 Tax=Streptomyces TaxID=1883 RepID=UPI001676F001|nr:MULTISPECIES: helix-turn-helix domain-containing protein [Streptomyces]MBK3525054.1 helix-turn-helix transcriptional regulator [Streptomyces sp. MBT70]GGR78043.1 transcriptional regulator [Streptomyces eurythermus]
MSRHPDRDQIRIESVLSALGSPVRLAVVRVLDAGGEHNCGSVLGLLGITAKSTMTHHWRVLRESGVIWQHPSGRENLLSLRRDDLDARYPGLLDAILAGADGDEALEKARRLMSVGGRDRSET